MDNNTLFPELEPSASEIEQKTLKELILLLENQTNLLRKEIDTNTFAIRQIKKILENKGA